ncbi:CocE/NonD family hydrolase [Actinomadura graeca]|uniref:CocE/NonD family hydrolase n=1 Tax=Actinomadura graeca TaxID=2750812 RepID=A0ABX8QZU3_9ACTN|nr:CocE/NonD family hydrolase [Actinomadura graeca]QXJ23846.1 CocE/NonD family hydrolase [Actinomadura graeca]
MDVDWHCLISQPEHGVAADKDVRVVMRDGVELAVDVFRPDGDGRYPALLSYSPYGKDVQRVLDKQRPHSSRTGNGGQEAGDTGYFVSRGYVHVIADVRGSGDSGGSYDFQGRREQLDGYDLIEWIAEQPWCDGNVGMLGMSYFGVVQNLVAATRPPHLKAIAPYEAYTDRYRHSVYHGGIFDEGFFHQWFEHLSVPPQRPLIYDFLDEKEVDRRRAALLAEPEIVDSPYLHIQLKYETKNPLMFDFLVEPHDGPYYWERSSNRVLDRIEVPALLMARWSGWPIHLAGAFEAWRGITAPKKMIIMETEWITGPMRPWRDHQDIILRWYDHWLKGNDTGMLDEPPITLLVKGTDEWRHEHEWPLARTVWTRFHLLPDGSLDREPDGSLDREPGTGEASLDFENDPWIRPGDTSPGLDFATPPLESPLEVTGPIALHLRAELDQPDATWIVTLRDVAPDGSSTVVTKGWLRASHRALDPERSEPYKPYHPHDRTVPVPVGEPQDYAIELRETSMVFRAGHRLLLQVRGQDTQTEEPVWYHTCNPVPTTHRLLLGGDAGSHLLLPVIES